MYSTIFMKLIRACEVKMGIAAEYMKHDPCACKENIFQRYIFLKTWIPSYNQLSDFKATFV